MSDIRAGKAFVEIGIKESLEKGLRNASQKLKAFGASMAGVGARMFALGTAAAAPFAGAIMAASDLEETMNKFNVVFGNNANAVKQWGDSYASAVGRSKKQVADFMANSADLFKPLGFDVSSATEMSKQVTQLAVDLASFNNKADADVLRDLHSALTGGGETVKKYGVVLDVAATKQELLNKGIDYNTATNAQKAQARLNIILKGTTDAQGDAIRSAGSFANQMKALKASIADTAAEIGTALLPIVTPLVTKVAEVVRWFAAFAAQNKALFVTVAKIAAGIAIAGAAFVAIGSAIAGVGVVVGSLATIVGVLGSVFAAIFSPIGVMVAAVASGIWVFRERIVSLFAPLKELWAFAQETFQGIAAAIQAGDIELAWKIVMLSLESVWVAAIERLKSKWFDVKEAIVSMWIDGVAKIKQIWIKAYTTIAKGLAWIYAKITGQDAEQMMAIVAENAGYEVAGVENNRQEKQRQLADEMEQQRAAELAALEERRKSILLERQNAIQTAKDKLEAAKKAAEVEAEPPPDASFDVPTPKVGVGQSSSLASVEYGTKAFEQFTKNRENIEAQMLEVQKEIAKNTANAPMIAEAT